VSALAPHAAAEHARPPVARRRWPDVLPAATATLAIAVFIVFGARLLLVGTGDLGIAGLFSTDEELAGELVQAMIRHGNFGLSHFFSYGPLDLYAARLVLWIWGLARPINDQAVLVTLRAVALAAGAGSVATTYVLGRRLWGAWTGALAAVVMATSATTLSWSTTAHPDMMQLFCVQISLLAASNLPRRPRIDVLLLASAGAALAFAAKYGGVLLLPVIWSALALGYLHDAPEPPRIDRGRLLVRLLIGVGLSVGTFIAGFLLLDPTVVGEWRGFVFQALTEASLAHSGHLYTVGANPALWLRRLGSANALGPAALTLGVAGVLCWAVTDARCLLRAGRAAGHFPWPDAAAGRLPLELWTLGYLLLLLVWVGDVQTRYALPMLPEMALFASGALRWAHGVLPRVFIALAVVAMLGPLARASVEFEQTQQNRLLAPAVAQRIAAGQWLAAHFDPTTPVLRDAYSYLPSSFDNSRETFGLTPDAIREFQPRVIVTDAAIRNRFADPRVAVSYSGGAPAFSEIAMTYQDIESGLLPCYPPLRQFGPVQIYGRPPGAGPAGQC